MHFSRCILVALTALLALQGAHVRRHSEQSEESGPPITTVTVHVDEGPVNTFVPEEALGAGVDGHEWGDTHRIFTRHNIREMRSAGFRSLTYRLRTELGIEAWHWNPRGTWSDPAHRQGYWTSSEHSDRPIDVSYGYSLPRRGSTIDQANNLGYSRIDDGDPATFWKSNPYLDSHYTHESNALHPQWIAVDFRKPARVNTARILWGVPYAVDYRIEYCARLNARDIEDAMPVDWRGFADGTVKGGRGGAVTIRLSREVVRARYFRIIMTRPSGTAPPGSRDVRDHLGYAVRELSLGETDSDGRFVDRIRHGRGRTRQSIIYASSTDPWHRAADLDRNVEQPGFDLVYRSGLTGGRPVLMPVPILYDTAENAAAEVRFLRRRGYHVREIEMGEEPDGQYANPEDYASLYLRCADAIRRSAPDLRLGGPCFQSTLITPTAWPDATGNTHWFSRFLAYIKARGRMADCQFFTFEWYPFDDVTAPTAPNLARAPRLLEGVIRRLQQDGLRANSPWMITEYGYSAFGGQPEVEMAGALFNADAVGTFLSLGGSRAYLYGYEPSDLIKEWPVGHSWGNNTLFVPDDSGQARYRTATYWAAWLLTHTWAGEGAGGAALYRAESDTVDGRGRGLVSVYPLKRGDGSWAVMLINKDPNLARRVRIRFRHANAPDSGVVGPADLYQFSSAQYLWHANGEHGHPIRSLPPAHRRTNADSGILLPPYSITVVRAQPPT